MIALVLLAGVVGALVRFVVAPTVHARVAMLLVNVAGSLLASVLGVAAAFTGYALGGLL